MAAHAPGWFEAVKSPNGWTYTLNPAGREPMPWPAWFRWLLGAGAIALIVAGIGILGWGGTDRRDGLEFPDRLVLGLIGLVFLFAGAGLAIGQLRQRAGRCELRLDAGAIRAIWRLGPISWSKTVRRSDAAQLAVVRRSVFLEASPIEGGPGDYYVLVVEDATGRRRDLVANYPREILLALAVELSSRWKVPDIDPDVDGIGAGKLAVVEDTEVPTDIRERRDLPLGSRLICERVGGPGVRVTKPPDGLAQGAGCLILMVGFGVAALILGIAGILTYGAIGVGALSCALALILGVGASTNRVVLAATPDRLTLETGDAVWGTSCRSWNKQDIAWIRAETTIESGGGSESGPVVKTHVLIRAKGPIEARPEKLWWGLGRGISKREMEWIATMLRAVLGVPATDAPTGNAIPAGSDESRGRRRPQ